MRGKEKREKKKSEEKWKKEITVPFRYLGFEDKLCWEKSGVGIFRERTRKTSEVTGKWNKEKKNAKVVHFMTDMKTFKMSG